MDELAVDGGLVLPLVKRLLIPEDDAVEKAGFDPNQDRDESGRWSESGAGGGKQPSGSTPGHWQSRTIMVRREGEEAGAPEIDKMLTRPGHYYRSMTRAEYFATVAQKLGVKSRQDFSAPGEGTSFSDKASDAESYVNFGKDDPRKTGDPTYLIEVEGDAGMERGKDGYMKVKDEIPYSRVTQIYEMTGAKDGPIFADLIGGSDKTGPGGSVMSEEQQHAEVERLSEKFNYPRMLIGVADTTQSFEVGGQKFIEAAHVNMEDNSMVLRPGFFSDAPGQREGMFAHEVMHARFNTVLQAYRDEQKAAENATTIAQKEAQDAKDPNWRKAGPVNAGGYLRTDDGGKKIPADVVKKYPTFAALQDYIENPMSGETGQGGMPIGKLEKEDGFTEYSKAWWKKWDMGQQMGQGIWSPVHETLAEIARYTVTRETPDAMRIGDLEPSAFYKKFYNTVNKAADKVNAPGKLPRVKSIAPPVYLFVDENFKPTKPSKAVLVKVHTPDRIFWGRRPMVQS